MHFNSLSAMGDRIICNNTFCCYEMHIFSDFWSSKIFASSMEIPEHAIVMPWAPAGGWESRPSTPPPWKIKKSLFCYIGGLFDTFLHMGGPFCYVFLIMWGPFHYFLLHGGGLFWVCPPYENFCGSPCSMHLFSVHIS